MMEIRKLAREPAFLLGTALLAWPTGGLAQTRTRETLANKVQAAAERDVTPIAAGALAARPEHYLGMYVQVRARVDDVHGAHALTLHENKLVAGPDVLVLIPRPGPELVSRDTEVTVTGTVRPLMVDELKREFDWFDLPPALEIGLKRRPVIVAESVRTSSGAELTRKRGGETADANAPMMDKTPAGTRSAAGPVSLIRRPRVPDVDQATGSPSSSTPAIALDTTTLTGCLTSAPDRPELFELTNASGAGKVRASTGSAPPTYRVESTSALDLSSHLGTKVRVTGLLEGLETSPTLRATSVEQVADTCDSSRHP